MTDETRQSPAEAVSHARCGCLTDVNAKLREHNTKLSFGFVLTTDLGGMDALPIVQTEKINSKQHGRPMSVIPTFCPFCGTKYPRQGDEGEGLPEQLSTSQRPEGK